MVGANITKRGYAELTKRLEAEYPKITCLTVQCVRERIARAKINFGKAAWKMKKLCGARVNPSTGEVELDEECVNEMTPQQ